jgi:ComF family protein
MDVSFASSFLYFYKDGITQSILHQFKYNNYPEIGELLGKWFAHDLIKMRMPDDIDLIIPVPLHPKKQRKRGYNQSQYFARGLSEVTGIATDFESLVRIEYQKSQTSKSKEQRWKSVKDAFEVVAKQNIRNRHILLVDDIITTGATMEACGRQLYAHGAAQISIATLGLSK